MACEVPKKSKRILGLSSLNTIVFPSLLILSVGNDASVITPDIFFYVDTLTTIEYTYTTMRLVRIVIIGTVYDGTRDT